jgi:hypothetical protein
MALLSKHCEATGATHISTGSMLMESRPLELAIGALGSGKPGKSIGNETVVNEVGAGAAV